MKKLFSLLLAAAMLLTLAGCGATDAGNDAAGGPPDALPAEAEQPQAASGQEQEKKEEQEEQTMETGKRVRFLVGENEIIVELEDNPAADSLYEMLPMELRFEDFNRTEKIAYPDEALTTDGAPDRCTPRRGDLCFYMPWGNLCFFYRDFRESSSLVPLGTVEAGMEYLEMLDTVDLIAAEAVL